MATQDEIQRFKSAMRTIYGSFDGLTEVEAQTWIPPDNPGARGHRGRYLWTDAFGVINFITLAKETVSPVYLVLAKRLVHAVHNVLGRTRDGTARLPPATDEEPLKGGLRIGKLEADGPDCDGQYHHYLLLWIFALNRLTLATGEKQYNRLAVQLAKAMFPVFIRWDKSVTTYGNGLRLAWKASVDMKTILVSEEGHYDAATGFVILRLVQDAAEQLDGLWGILSREIASYRIIMSREGRLTVSYDPLDFGMGLWMLHFFRNEEWARSLGIQSLALAQNALNGPTGINSLDLRSRVAFREFGTCLGLQCYGVHPDLRARLQEIVIFWQNSGYFNTMVDEGLKPTTFVMYAAALIPGAFRDGYIWRWRPS